MQKITLKETDNKGQIALGQKHADKQWQLTELENGSVLLIPIVIATDEEAMEAFEKALKNHQNTIKALK